MPPKRVLGCTVETDNHVLISKVSKAPLPETRIRAMRILHEQGEQTFITIEPILKCNPYMLTAMIMLAQPDFVNIGADSKRSTLPEPSAHDVGVLIAGIQRQAIEIRAKNNLERLTLN